jgi:predicted small lipoprotein YifL
MTKRALVLGTAAILTLAACGSDGPSDDPETVTNAAAEIWLDTIAAGKQDAACELYHETGMVFGGDRYEEFGVSEDALGDSLREWAEKACP